MIFIYLYTYLIFISYPFCYLYIPAYFEKFMVNIIVAPKKKLVLMRDVVALVSEKTRSCSDSDFSENTTITVLPGYLYVISGKYIKIMLPK